MKIISLEAAFHAGMTPAHAEDLADWHDAHAELEVATKRKLRHEVVAFRFRKLAHALRSVQPRSIHRKVA